MSRFIESRENFLWSLGSAPEKDDSVVAYIPGACNSVLGIVCPHLACDAVILPQKDWKIFKKYASKDLKCLEEKSGIRIKESFARDMNPTRLEYFTKIKNHRTYSYFASIATILLQKLIAEYSPIYQFTFRSRLVPEEDRRRLRWLFVKKLSDTHPVEHFISYAKLWKNIKTNIILREKYENNIELYMPEIFNLPDDIIIYIKSFL